MDLSDSFDSHSPYIYGRNNVIQDLFVFNVDSWLHKGAELIDFRNDNIERPINWFEPDLQKAGCQVDDTVYLTRVAVCKGYAQLSVLQQGLQQFVEDVPVQRSIQVRSQRHPLPGENLTCTSYIIFWLWMYGLL